jgi:hypothetical protein
MRQFCSGVITQDSLSRVTLTFQVGNPRTRF